MVTIGAGASTTFGAGAASAIAAAGSVRTTELPSAAACGVPVVLSDQCGATEWLHPRATRIVPYGDVGALTAALDEALHEDAVVLAARQAASSVRASLSWPEIARRQSGVYSGLAQDQLRWTLPR